MSSRAEVRRQVLVDTLARHAERGYGVTQKRLSGSGAPVLTVELAGTAVHLLATCRALREFLDAQQAASVQDARAQGYSWDELGLVLGVSGAAVRQRYGKGSGDG